MKRKVARLPIDNRRDLEQTIGQFSIWLEILMR
jgi:hypothetical protein